MSSLYRQRLSSPEIVYTICEVNECNFPIIHTIMFVILKVSMKRRLLDGIWFHEIPVGWLVIAESRSKTFSTTCLLFWVFFAWKKIHNIAGTTAQVIGLNAIFPLGSERSKCFSSYNMFAYFAPSTSTWPATAFLFFKRCYFRSHKNVFQTLIIGIFSNNLPMFSVRCL